MNTFFCSDHAREVGEDIISSATNYQTYILVECPQPWSHDALKSRWVPNNLQILVEKVYREKLPVRFLLICNNNSHKVDYSTLLIYQKQEGLSHGYQKYEFKLSHIEQVAGVVKQYLSGEIPDHKIETNVTRDILICTHGSHDQCCARYGSPFYFQATQTIADLGWDNVRVWKSSHFGGHRFAPTAIDLPDGRYYGVLNQEVFKSILTRTGDIQSLSPVYRGWGILPTAVQILERELMLRHGWNWFNYKVAGKIIQQSLDNNTILAELSFENNSNSLFIYQAKLIKDTTRTLEIKGSCNAKENSIFVKYAVDSISLICEKVATCSN
ncbi:sucrase ferredoxin [Nodularia harveyana UHCC-0300]|uniref:Sucrase ferredoxin n=1 Tax=Nodularia harveyana UHCC-0300 TaxID=2974287 RepID=A0ABU5UEY8_9CYAN|nr:sucrase ferredoxin [Nodularia harveyana]MEA5582119.1 sucrase ferredoxin [Nodularia harveyana UHCC-0300]